jgi:hypothetical protein
VTTWNFCSCTEILTVFIGASPIKLKADPCQGIGNEGKSGQKFQAFRILETNAIEASQDLVIELVRVEAEETHASAEGFITKSLIKNLKAHFNAALLTEAQANHRTAAIEFQKAKGDLGPGFPIDIKAKVWLNMKGNPRIGKTDAQRKTTILALESGFPLMGPGAAISPAICRQIVFN